MADAVIVATARSPIGRAFKESVKDLRPDDIDRLNVHGGAIAPGHPFGMTGPVVVEERDGNSLVAAPRKAPRRNIYPGSNLRRC